MRAAIYARKSNDQDDLQSEQKSVERQVEGARVFIEAKGWSLDAAHIFKDELSGALFEGRHHFQRMLAAANAGAFDTLVIFDIDRFGRHGHNTMVALNRLADLGVTVWDFSTGQRVDLDSFGGRLTTILKAEFAQEYRDQVRKHTTASMKRKAEQGFVTGGKVFGYDNVKLAPGQTIRKVNHTEAAVVRDIYIRTAAGEGAFTIAEALNSLGAPSPRAQLGRPNGWSVSTVREVLKRPLYRGERVWGKTASKYGRELGRLVTTKGRVREKAQVPTPEDTWLRLPVDDSLRIIDADLAARVDARRLDRRTRYLASLSTPGTKAPEKAHGKYLLSGGMLLCPTCGSHFEGIKYPKEVYVCSTRRRKPGVCSNKLTLPMAYADDQVLDMVEGEVLGTKFIEELLSLVDQGGRDDSARLGAERDRLRGEVDNLIRSIAAGVAADSIASAIRERELEIARLEVRLRAPRPEAPKLDQLREALTQRAAEWRATLRAEPKVARLLLRRLIGPLEVPVEDGTRPDFIEAVAEVRTGLLDGLAEIHHVASPTGFEPVF